MIKLNLPLSDKDIENLKVGDEVLLSGALYTARDAAHKRMVESLPFDINNQIIYYVGPTEPKKGEIYGSCGPTTAGRMDKYTPYLFDNGLKGCIGKGKRNKEVKEAIVRNKGIYFVTIGGLGALLSKCVTDVELIAYEDLGTEAIRKITVKDFPVYVGIDSKGKDIYE